MPRGVAAEDGTERESANGYRYVRVEGTWVLKHHLVAAEILGRPVDTSKEVIRFKDKDRTNFTKENIVILPKGTSSIRKRLAQVEALIAEYTAQRDILLKELDL